MVSERKEAARRAEWMIVVLGAGAGLFAVLVHAVANWADDYLDNKGVLYLGLLIGVAILLLVVPSILTMRHLWMRRENHPQVGEVQKIQA